MNQTNYKTNLYLFFFLKLFFIFKSIEFVLPKPINNIIRLGDDNFRYSHFSFNSDGDMIVDSESYPVSKERRFFGLKKNGLFYFTDSNNQPTPYYSMNATHNEGRIEGESKFIKLTSSYNEYNGRELLCGISKNTNYFVEFYNFNYKNITEYSTDSMFGNLISEFISFMELPNNSENNYNYIITYLFQEGYNCFLIIREMKFSFDESNGYRLIKEISFQSGYKRIISCFFTVQLKYICFYDNFQLTALVFENIELSNYTLNVIYFHEPYSLNDKFLKAIHFIGEIGVFAFYTEEIDNFPFISFYKCNSNNELIIYNSFGNILIDKVNLNNNFMLNDLVKLNENQICFVSSSTDKLYLYIVVFSLYNDYSKMNIRYYSIAMWNDYKHIFFKEIKSSLYKNFLSIAYSHCPQLNCTSDEFDTHYASLIIFNYPNSTDNSLDIIPELFNNNKNIENDFSFNFKGKITIENNIFGFVFKGTRIMKIPDNIHLTNITNRDILESESIVLEDENVSLSFDTHEQYTIGDYVIEYAYVLTEPNYEDINNYIINSYSINGNIEKEEKYYQYNNYTGKSSNFTLIISDTMNTNCHDENCALCFTNNTCITCKYNYTINSNIKTCFPNLTEQTTILKEPTTILKEPTTILKEPTTILKEPTIILKEPTTILKESTTILKEPTTILKEPTTILKEPTTILKEPTTILKEPTTILKEPTTILKEPITILKEPTTILKEPTTILKEPTTILKEPTTILNEPTTILKHNFTTFPLKNEKTIISTIKNVPIMTTSLSVNPNQNCTKNEILNHQCKKKLSSEQIGDIYKELQSKIQPDTNELIETENAIFQVSTLEGQKNNNNPNVSSIYLGECEQRLKEQEGLSDEDDLIVFKTDIKNEGLSSTYVQYEIYNPITLQPISLEVCKDIPISVSVPVNLDENTKSIYDSLSKSGYNLFDLNDSFYNDICSTYTTENGTDLTLVDRKNLIYDNNGNVSLCQDGCTFESYNLTTKKAKCDCSVQIEAIITNISKIKFDKNELVDSFFSTLKNSNFLVLKCYKLAFSLKGQKNNIGSYIMSGITFIFIILSFVYIINGNSKLTFYIQIILRTKLNYKATDKKSKTTLLKNSPKNQNIKLYNKTNIKNNNKIIKDKMKKKQNEHNNKNRLNKKNKTNIPQKGKKNKNFPPKRKLSIKSTNKSNNQFSQKRSYENLINLSRKKSEHLKSRGTNKIKRKSNSNNKDKNKISIEKPINDFNIKNTKMYLDKYKIKDLNDEEMNNLEYEIALIIDKRTYFQYYYSLLKKKHLILFAFLPSNDYNLMAIKISLLLLSFSLYFTINGFFFSDETMNKINEDNGVYDIIYQIPQILYSTVISAVINMILKRLSLSEKQILSIKMERDYLMAQKKSNSIKSCLKIKLVIFFILSLILMLFFWYFISCFCAVYKNTQMILINDTLVSFALSMLYPFGLNLLPGMFRIPALRAIKKDKKCLYKASNLISLI